MKLACIQMNSSDDWQHNMHQALELTTQAAEAGAKLIALPENVLAMMPRASLLFDLPLEKMTEIYLQALQEVSQKYRCSILAGTIPAPTQDKQKLWNRAHLVTESGITIYDKIHLCDINVPGATLAHESNTFEYGERIAIANTAAGTLGITICYDLRFPHLFRTLAKQGAEIIAVPSAFTAPTGEAHWHTLLRARAIENGCYILAPAQTGIHPGNRKTYGHALMVDPWGNILADAGTEPGVIFADFSRAYLEEIRQKVPALQQDRPFLA